MWYNLLPVDYNGNGDFIHSCYCVAVSSSPMGPFETIMTNLTGIGYHALPDAPALFVDDDGSAYIAFTDESNHINHVQKLRSDLLGPSSPMEISPQIGPANNEGIFMFKRNGLYYVGFGACCCFCAEGSNVDLYFSKNPLGPYAFAGRVETAESWRAQTLTGGEQMVFWR